MSAARRPTPGHDPASVMAATGGPARNCNRRVRSFLARRLPAPSFMCWMSRASRSHGTAIFYKTKIVAFNLTATGFSPKLVAMKSAVEILRHHGIRITPQRTAVAKVVFKHKGHPSAEEIWEDVRRRCPTLSRATVYNTLNLFVEKGLLKRQVLTRGMVVLDHMTSSHHHFIDEKTNKIYDVPWEAIKVDVAGLPPGFDVGEYQVVLRGKRRP